MQLTNSLGMCRSGEAQQQTCCALAAVLASRRCHCRLGVPRQSIAQLEHVTQQCMRAHRAMVEEHISGLLPGTAPNDAPGSSPAAAGEADREPAPGSWADLTRGAMDSTRETTVDGVASTIEADLGSGAEGGNESPEGEPRYTMFGQWARQEQLAGGAVPPVRLFVGVLTAGKNVDRRAAIRDSWGADRRLHRCASILHIKGLITDEVLFTP